MTYKAEIQKIITFVSKKLDEGKAENIVKLDVRKLSSITDVMIIATGTSTRHVMALAHHLAEDLKKQKILLLNDIYQGDGNWVVVDLGSVLVHIFTQEARAKYDLENLWRVSKPGRTRKAPQKNA